MDGKTILAFLLGTVTGAAGTYLCLREATERYISNEIQAFKEEWAETHKTPENGVYEATEASQEGSEDEHKANMTKSSLEEGRKQAQAIIQKRNYATALPENEHEKISEEEIEKVIPGISRITYEQYRDDEDYKKTNIDFLPDAENDDDPDGYAMVEVTNDEDINVITNARELVGKEVFEDLCKGYIAEPTSSLIKVTDDTIYIRNDLTKTDYQVVRYDCMTVNEYMEYQHIYRPHDN